MLFKNPASKKKHKYTTASWIQLDQLVLKLEDWAFFVGRVGSSGIH